MPNPPNKKRRGLLDVAKENAALNALHQQNYVASLRGGPESDSQALTSPLQFIKAIVGQTPQYGQDEAGQRVELRPGKGLLGGFANLAQMTPEQTVDLTEAGDFRALTNAAANVIAKPFGKGDMSWPAIGMSALAALPFVTGGGAARSGIRSAIELPDGRVFRAPDAMPNHYGAWELAANELGMPLDELLDMPGVVEGFEDGGKFLDRAAGLKRAAQLEQLNPNGYSQNLGKLDSEDLLFAKGGSLGGLLRVGEFFDRNAPKLEGTLIHTPQELTVPITKTAKSELPWKLSDLVQGIKDDPSSVLDVLRSDILRRADMADEPWYELGMMKQAFDAEGGPGAMTFDEFNILGGAASQRNGVLPENAVVSVLNYMRMNGIPLKQALEDYKVANAGFKKADGTPAGISLIPGSSGHERGLTQLNNPSGLLLPADAWSESWKTPKYSWGRRGGRAVALDAHERRRIWQAVLADPRLAKIAEESGAYGVAMKATGKKGPLMAQIPFKHAGDYQTIEDVLYNRLSEELGMLPTAAQAQRWRGGAEFTGVDTPVEYSFPQLFEGQLISTLQHRGIDPTGKNVTGLLRDFLRGRKEGMLVPSMPIR